MLSHSVYNANGSVYRALAVVINSTRQFDQSWKSVLLVEDSEQRVD